MNKQDESNEVKTRDDGMQGREASGYLRRRREPSGAERASMKSEKGQGRVNQQVLVAGSPKNVFLLMEKRGFGDQFSWLVRSDCKGVEAQDQTARYGVRELQRVMCKRREERREEKIRRARDELADLLNPPSLRPIGTRALGEERPGESGKWEKTC